MRCPYACGSPEHRLARRQFLAGLTTGVVATGLSPLAWRPALAHQVASAGKRALMIYLHGGASQLETWDPKPKTDTGGPFRAIPSSVPGLFVSELLPLTAQQMHHLLVVRGVNTAENDHGLGSYIMHTGRRKDPSLEYPHLGSVVAKCLTTDADALPGYIHVSGGSGLSPGDATYLGPKYASVLVGGGQPPPNSARLEHLSPEADQARQDLRQRVNERFTRRRRAAETTAYSHSFHQAQELMSKREIFDLSRESERDHERYGKHEFGQHCLLARRLLEQGITFVKVGHSNYDTHNENFDFHLEQIGEFDRPFACLIGDLAERGLLESTLVIVCSEFGRTPSINRYCGRDHWGSAWSVVLGGCGLQCGGAYGATNANGTAVADGEVNGAQLFHTYLRALGVDSSDSFQVGGRAIPMADPAFGPIEKILA